MLLELDSLRKAVSALGGVLAKSADEEFMSTIDNVAQDAVKSGVIQHFEFTYELSWKFMKRWLENNVSVVSVDGVTRRELYRQAAGQLLIDDVEKWMRYHEARNLSSHTYEPEIADEVYAVVQDFVRDATALLQSLEARND